MGDYAFYAGAVVVGLFMLGAVINLFTPELEESAAGNADHQAQASTVESITICGATAEEFAQVRMGMSLRQVQQIIGCPGEELSRSEIAGYRTAMYSWNAERGFGNMNLMIQNGEVVTKSQFGLR